MTTAAAGSRTSRADRRPHPAPSPGPRQATARRQGLPARGTGSRPAPRRCIGHRRGRHSGSGGDVGCQGRQPSGPGARTLGPGSGAPAGSRRGQTLFRAPEGRPAPRRGVSAAQPATRPACSATRLGRGRRLSARGNCLAQLHGRPAPEQGCPAPGYGRPPGPCGGARAGGPRSGPGGTGAPARGADSRTARGRGAGQPLGPAARAAASRCGRPPGGAGTPRTGGGPVRGGSGGGCRGCGCAGSS